MSPQDRVEILLPCVVAGDLHPLGCLCVVPLLVQHEGELRRPRREYRSRVHLLQPRACRAERILGELRPACCELDRRGRASARIERRVGRAKVAPCRARALDVCTCGIEVSAHRLEAPEPDRGTRDRPKIGVSRGEATKQRDRFLDRPGSELERDPEHVDGSRNRPARAAVARRHVFGRLLHRCVLAEEGTTPERDAVPRAAERTVVLRRLEHGHRVRCCGQERAYLVRLLEGAQKIVLERRAYSMMAGRARDRLAQDLHSSFGLSADVECDGELAREVVGVGSQFDGAPEQVHGGRHVAALPRSDPCAAEPLTPGTCKRLGAIAPEAQFGDVPVRLLEVITDDLVGSVAPIGSLCCELVQLGAF